jgi:hypothetical protein
MERPPARQAAGCWLIPIRPCQHHPSSGRSGRRRGSGRSGPSA